MHTKLENHKKARAVSTRVIKTREIKIKKKDSGKKTLTKNRTRISFFILSFITLRELMSLSPVELR